MPVAIQNGDLFETQARFICHQVNCQGRMGSGVAKQVRSYYPEAYAVYKELCDAEPFRTDPALLLGRIQIVPCENGVSIVNLFAQNRYGYDGAAYTDYQAFQQCLSTLAAEVPTHEAIAMPYRIGCGLGGGDWDVVLAMINHAFPQHRIELRRKR